jgi:hypothetical protein
VGPLRRFTDTGGGRRDAYLLVIQCNVAGAKRGEADGAGTQEGLGDGRDAEAHLVPSGGERASVEGGVGLFGVSAGEIQGGAHVEVDILKREGRDKGVSRERGESVVAAREPP